MRRPVILLGLLTAILTVIVVVLPATSASAGGGGCHTPRQEVTDTNVDIATFCFIQTVVHVSPGQSVTWTNRDNVGHSVTGVGGEWGGYDVVTGGGTVVNRFDTAGVYPYFCYLHPGMVGAVVVDTKTGIQTAAAQAAPSGTGGLAGTGGTSTIVWLSVGSIAVVALVAAAVYLIARRRVGIATTAVA